MHYGPLYCFVARIPLYLGYAIDCVAGGASLPTSSFFVHPTLTDSGVLVLLLSQHISLCLATFHLITETTRLFWVRLTLAVAWAANPLFYTFAHCIGAETLSLILVILIGATGLRIIRYSVGFLGKNGFFSVFFCGFDPNPVHQRHSGWIAAGYVPALERIRVNHDRIRSILVTSPFATITGQTSITKKRRLLSPSALAASSSRTFLYGAYAMPLKHPTIPQSVSRFCSD